ncbi:NAD(P)H-dependent oxidoreductase [Caballeronia sp. 15711]|uniref:NAD(P)H-dependent oxidoreductase n=1 Tax=Caballeronia sp. 15711 TaxID=3391029 RepID=UPI0039E2BC94
MLRDRPVFAAVSSGGRLCGERASARFSTPYLKAALGTVGLHDLTFFSIEGTACGPDAATEARTKTGQALRKSFLRFACISGRWWTHKRAAEKKSVRRRSVCLALCCQSARPWHNRF